VLVRGCAGNCSRCSRRPAWDEGSPRLCRARVDLIGNKAKLCPLRRVAVDIFSFLRRFAMSFKFRQVFSSPANLKVVRFHVQVFISLKSLPSPSPCPSKACRKVVGCCERLRGQQARHQDIIPLNFTFGTLHGPVTCASRRQSERTEGPLTAAASASFGIFFAGTRFEEGSLLLR
jgi:hypothetical protein